LTGYRISALVIDPSKTTTLYAESSHYTYPGSMRYIRSRVFKSTDGGGNWSEIHDSNTDFLVLAIDPLMPNTVYAGGFGNGLFKSTDGGGTWRAVTPDPFVYALAIDPMTPNTLYAGTGTGVFKSMDGGESWTTFNTGLNKTDVRALAIDPISPNILYVGTGSGVFKITNNITPTP
jgi:photosystem II stability/assembly factor-like uncharacterized protein